MSRTLYTWKGVEYTIDHFATGWWTSFVAGFGYVKSDSLDGCKEMIKKYAK